MGPASLCCRRSGDLQPLVWSRRWTEKPENCFPRFSQCIFTSLPHYFILCILYTSTVLVYHLYHSSLHGSFPLLPFWLFLLPFIRHQGAQKSYPSLVSNACLVNMVHCRLYTWFGCCLWFKLGAKLGERLKATRHGWWKNTGKVDQIKWKHEKKRVKW